jgi:gamma-glutamyltranspeptidase / glutathione hydrolase
VDKDQNVVSWTATHGDDFGAHVAIDGLGLMLGHGMSRFDVYKSSPNYPAPRKRPQHNMAPVVVLRDGKPWAGLGMPGGSRIVSVTTQVAVSLIDFKAGPQQAVSAPRVHAEGREPVRVNFDVPAAVIEELKSRGHQVEYMEPLGGDANAIIIDAKTGQLQAAASKSSDGVLVF